MKKTLDQISELIEPLLTPMHEQHLNKEVWTNLNKIKAILNNPSQPERVEGGIPAEIRNKLSPLKNLVAMLQAVSNGSLDADAAKIIEQQLPVCEQSIEYICNALKPAAPSAVDWDEVHQETQGMTKAEILEYIQANYTLTAKD